VLHLEVFLEYFKDIPGYEGIYQVSNHGRVTSVRRKVVFSPSITQQGYKRVILRVNKYEKSRTIHSLVMEAFRGPRPSGMVINHLDFNPSNNHLSNLEYVTKLDNILYSKEAGRYFRSHSYADDKFSPKDIRFIRSSSLDDAALATQFKSSKSFINKIRRSVSYSWVK
jgi:hypothetical protein